MCDYSLQTVNSRPAKVGEKLTTHHFNTGTVGFAAPEDANTAVCVLPGTELAFTTPVRCNRLGLLGWKPKVLNHTTAIFRQVNTANPRTHHDALEFPDGQRVLLTGLVEGSGSNGAPASGSTHDCHGSKNPRTSRLYRLNSFLHFSAAFSTAGGLYFWPDTCSVARSWAASIARCLTHICWIATSAKNVMIAAQIKIDHNVFRFCSVMGSWSRLILSRTWISFRQSEYQQNRNRNVIWLRESLRYPNIISSAC